MSQSNRHLLPIELCGHGSNCLQIGRAGKKVVSSLNTDDLEAGRKHLLYFQGVQMSTGQYWYVSVIVARGARPGKRITLTSGVHGDEMSSIRTVQIIMDQLDPARMSGTVMAVLDISRPAIESMQRRWANSGRGIDLIDMNREWPGNENGATAASRHAGIVFNRLLRPNSDLANSTSTRVRPASRSRGSTSVRGAFPTSGRCWSCIPARAGDADVPGRRAGDLAQRERRRGLEPAREGPAAHAELLHDPPRRDDHRSTEHTRPLLRDHDGPALDGTGRRRPDARNRALWVSAGVGTGLTARRDADS